MTDRSMTLVNAGRLGELIIEWAKDPSSRPVTVADFKEAVGENVVILGIGYKLDEVINYVDLPSNAKTFSIVISHKDDLNQPSPPAPADYPLPDFYEDLAFHVAQKVTDRDQFKRSRIADYSTGKCQ